MGARGVKPVSFPASLFDRGAAGRKTSPHNHAADQAVTRSGSAVQHKAVEFTHTPHTCLRVLHPHSGHKSEVCKARRMGLSTCETITLAAGKAMGFARAQPSYARDQ